MSRSKQPVPIGTVRREWIDWYPQMGWNASFWVAVAKQVKRERVRGNDKERVKRICRKIHGNWRALA